MLVEPFKFKKSQADAYVLTRKDKYGVIILCTYVDNALMAGDLKTIEKTVSKSRQKFHSRMLGYCQNMLAAQ